MSRKKVILLTLLLVLGLLVSFWWFWPDDNLRVIGCDVGQGDSILIVHGFSQVLVDGGPGEEVLSCLGRHMPFWDRQIEVVVMTHPQADHMNGLASVLGRYKVGLWVAGGVAGESEKFEEILSKLKNGVVSKTLVPQKGDSFFVGDMKFDVWWPEKRWGGAGWWDKAIKSTINIADYTQEDLNISDLNETSVVLALSWGEFSAVLTGDISTREELAIVESGVIKPADVLKIAHHGSKYSSEKSFLEGIRPKIGIISAGKNNRFGHPTRDVLIRLDILGVKILRTDELGDVVVATDGEKIWVEE